MNKPVFSQNYCTLTLAHPLEDRPLSEQLSDDACDDLGRQSTPEGFVLRTTIQFRDASGKRRIRATYARLDPVPFPTDTPPVMTAQLKVPS